MTSLRIVNHSTCPRRRKGGEAGLVGHSPHSYRLFFFNDTATTKIYTLSLHDALPICNCVSNHKLGIAIHLGSVDVGHAAFDADRKSTRLYSSHSQISYAVFCLKKKPSAKMHALEFWKAKDLTLSSDRSSRRGTDRPCSARCSAAQRDPPCSGSRTGFDPAAPRRQKDTRGPSVDLFF